MISPFLQGVVIGAAVYVTNALTVLGMYHIARSRGVHVKLVSIGIGPRVTTYGRVVWRWLPLGGFVRMFDTTCPEKEDAGLDPATAFNHQTRTTRALIAVGGSLAGVVIAVALRGLDGWHSFARGFGQWISGALDPTGTGVALIQGFGAVVEQGSVLTTVSVIAAKMAALNLLPIPILPGFAVLFQWLGPDPSSARYQRVYILTQQIGIWVFFALIAAWLWALWTAAFSN
jgi:membrane-associated protease RseP (regulator of RpoE activity)